VDRRRISVGNSLRVAIGLGRLVARVADVDSCLDPGSDWSGDVSPAGSSVSSRPAGR